MQQEDCTFGILQAEKIAEKIKIQTSRQIWTTNISKPVKIRRAGCNFFRNSQSLQKGLNGSKTGADSLKRNSSRFVLFFLFLCQDNLNRFITYIL